MSNFRKKKKIIKNNTDIINQSVKEEINKPVQKEKKEIIIDIIDDIKIDNKNTDIINNNKLLKSNDNLKKLNNRLLIDIDKKDKEIKLLNKKISDNSLRNTKILRDNKKEFFKICYKIKKNLINYISYYNSDKEIIKNTLNDIIYTHQENLNNTNDIIKKINNKFHYEIKNLNNTINELNLSHEKEISNLKTKNIQVIDDLKTIHINEIDMLNNQYNKKIQDIHKTYDDEINNLKAKHDLHINNIKKLHSNEIDDLNQKIKNINNISHANKNLSFQVTELNEKIKNISIDYEDKLNIYKKHFQESEKNINLFQNNLNKVIFSLYDDLKKDRFHNPDYFNVCIYNKDIEYDYEFKKDFYNKIFYYIQYVPFKKYSKSFYISKYMNIIKYIELFLETDQKFMFFIDSNIKTIYNHLFIKNELNKLSNLDFNILLLNSNDDYNFLNKKDNLIKVNNIKNINSFIVNRIYANKLMKIISDCINKLIDNNSNDKISIEYNLNKILNDQKCFLYYHQFFKHKNDLKTLFILLDKNIDTSNIGYNYEFVNPTNLDIVYTNDGIKYIPSKDDHILEIIKHYKDMNYDNLLIINQDTQLIHLKCFSFINKYCKTDKILIDNTNTNLFINYNNDYDYNQLFNEQNNFRFLKFDLS